ncbi:hypothetical protein GCK32_021147 [Trichostrongylus colubriformis]|uniref:Uncharacterized protein n=1 Tax=Trichostrongylus colubriformis TaxID=6319 RepID=A0AAN8IHK1_TRICO
MIQVDQMLVRDGKEFYIVKRVRRYHIGKASSINAEIKVSKKQGGWKRQLLKSGKFDSLFKKCKPFDVFTIPVDYYNYTQNTKNSWYYAKAY